MPQAQGEIGYYPQHPKVLLPVGIRGSPSEKFLPMGMSSTCNDPLVYEGMQPRISSYNLSYSNQETLDLFPVHPTGILGGKTTHGQVSSLVSVSADSSTDTPFGSSDYVNEDVDCSGDRPFFDFFTFGQGGAMYSSALSIALTLVFGCIVLGLILGLGYLLWWKKRRTSIGIEKGEENNVKLMLYRTCWKTQSTINPRSVNVATNQKNISSVDEPDLELGSKVSTDDMLLKTLDEEGVESELMRLHNLPGPPRFLFTIKEETREDLESEDRSRKGSSTRSLSDIMVANNTPFLSPLACSPSRCHLDNTDSYKHHGLNPLFESSLESDSNRFRTSPPPKFKFIRDAEEKLCRRLIEEAQRKAQKNLDPVTETEFKDSSNSVRVTEERDKSLLRFMNNKEKELREVQQHLPKLPSNTAQVLPLNSSPTTTFKPVEI
ncbi:unnamed protein product [Lupinus luteus]|uniref:Uncharacterized protein n=1 Tax=Lupinus luteus TaxID=3873 RepID=A0AAV1Y528_LUPLU